MSGMPASDDACEQKNGRSQADPPRRAGMRKGSGFTGSSVDGCKQAITAAREGFNKTGVFGGIPEGIAQALDGGVQAMIEVYKGIGRPKPAVHFLPGNNFTGTLKEHGQNLERLLLKPDSDAIAAKLTGAKVCFKGSKADDMRDRIL